jgi:hypothetical protein
LSVQMPVLKADAKGEEYPPTFDEAAERIKTAIDFMPPRATQNRAGVAQHGQPHGGAHYLQRNPNRRWRPGWRSARRRRWITAS